MAKSDIASRGPDDDDCLGGVDCGSFCLVGDDDGEVKSLEVDVLLALSS